MTKFALAKEILKHIHTLKSQMLVLVSSFQVLLFFAMRKKLCVASTTWHCLLVKKGEKKLINKTKPNRQYNTNCLLVILLQIVCPILLVLTSITQNNQIVGPTSLQIKYNTLTKYATC